MAYNFCLPVPFERPNKSGGRDTSNLQTFDITVIRIADYINNVVGTRKIPGNKKGAVVMKLDVEVIISLETHRFKNTST